MSKGDLLVERGAKRLEELSRKAAARGGYAARFSDELAEDAVFLRKLKPSLIKARAKGKAPVTQAAPINQAPEPEPESRPPSAPPTARPRRRRKAKRPTRLRGPNPFVVMGVALVAGIALAKVIDWRGHAHPRD